MTLRPSGLYVALVTPMSDEGQFDSDAMTRHVEFLLGQGVEGLVALGTTGEFSDLAYDERGAVVSTVVSAAESRVPVIAGIGALGTRSAIDESRRMCSFGVDALLVLPPLYWPGLTDGEIAEHVGAVAREASLPTLFYDYPVAGRRAIDPDVLCDLAESNDLVVGVKQTVMDVGVVARMSATVTERVPDFVLGVGFEQVALASAVMGGSLVISGLGNFCAPLLRELLDALGEGDARSALAAHRRILALTEIYDLSQPPVAAIKVAARRAGAPIGETTRVARLDESARYRIERALARAAVPTPVPAT